MGCVVTKVKDDGSVEAVSLQPIQNKRPKSSSNLANRTELPGEPAFVSNAAPDKILSEAPVDPGVENATVNGGCDEAIVGLADQTAVPDHTSTEGEHSLESTLGQSHSGPAKQGGYPTSTSAAPQRFPSQVVQAAAALLRVLLAILYPVAILQFIRGKLGWTPNAQTSQPQVQHLSLQQTISSDGTTADGLQRARQEGSIAELTGSRQGQTSSLAAQRGVEAVDGQSSVSTAGPAEGSSSAADNELQPHTPPQLEPEYAAGPSLQLEGTTAGLHVDSSVPAQLFSPGPSTVAHLEACAEALAAGQLLRADASLKEAAEAEGVAVEELVRRVRPEDVDGLDLRKLQAEVAQVRLGLRGLAGEEGWMVSRNDDLKVLYRHERGTAIHSVKIQAVFNSPMEQLLAMAREFDLVRLWNRYAVDPAVLLEPGVFDSYVYCGQWLPFPFPAMDAVMHARGVDLAEEERCLLVIIESRDSDSLPPECTPLPAAAAKRKRVDVLAGTCLKLEPYPPGPDGKERTRAALLAIVDPKIPYVPPVLVNFVLKVLSPFVYHQMCKQLAAAFSDAGKPFPKRMRAKPHLYGLVRQKMEAYQEVLQAEWAAGTIPSGVGMPGKHKAGRA